MTPSSLANEAVMSFPDPEHVNFDIQGEMNDGNGGGIVRLRSLDSLHYGTY